MAVVDAHMSRNHWISWSTGVGDTHRGRSDRSDSVDDAPRSSKLAGVGDSHRSSRSASVVDSHRSSRGTGVDDINRSSSGADVDDRAWRRCRSRRSIW